MSRYGQIVGDRGRLPEFVSVEHRKSSELTKTEARCHLCNRRSIAPRQKDASDFHQSEFSQIAGWSAVMHHLEGARNGTRVCSGEAAKIIDAHDVAEVGACNSDEMFDDLRIPIHRPSDGLAFFTPAETPANTKLLQTEGTHRINRLGDKAGQSGGRCGEQLAEIKFLSAQSILDCILAPDPKKTICTFLRVRSAWISRSSRRTAGPFLVDRHDAGQTAP